MVTVPDARMYELQKIAKTQVVIPAVIEFVDIAGLVKGASRSEGLRNKFLTHIREVDAIVQVVRCFDDEDIHHVSGSGGSRARHRGDLDRADARRPRHGEAPSRARFEGRKARRQDGDGGEAVLAKLEDARHGQAGARGGPDAGGETIARSFFLLSDKRTIFACNVRESEMATATRTRTCRRCAST